MNRIFRILLLTLLIHFSGDVCAASLDSLQQALTQEQDAGKRLPLLNQVVEAMRYKAPVEAMTYAREQLELARSMDDPKLIAGALGQMADIYFNVQAYPKTLEIAREMEQVAKEAGNNLGLGNAYNSVGTVYHMQKDTVEAIRYYELAIASFKKSSKADAHVGSLNNIASLLIGKGQYDEAESKLLEALAGNRKSGRKRWLVYNLNHLGNLEAKRGNTKKAWAYAREAFAFSDSVRFPDGRAASLLLMADLEFDAGRFWESRQVLETQMITDSATSKPYLLEAYLKLATIYKLGGSFRSAYRYLDLAHGIQEELNEMKLAEQVENIELANELKVADRMAEIEREREAQVRDDALENAKLGTYITLLMLLVVVALALGLFVAFIIKRRSNRVLASLVKQRTQALVATNEELNTFMYRSSHEIRGAINSIQGLYDLAIHYPSDQEQVMELLGIKVMQLEHGQRNLIYTMELRDAEAKAVEVEVRKTVNEAVARIRERRFEAKFDFRLEMPSNVRLKTDPWMLSIVIENLLDNCVVFRDKSQAAWCRVTGKQVADGVEIRIEDNGVGIPPEVRERAFEMFFRGSLDSAGSGLGLYNVQLAMDKLGGSVTLSPKPGKGTLVVVHLPKQLPA